MKIDPSTVTPEKLFTGISTRYQVPHYQRDYAWTLDNWQELWNDVYAASQKNTAYFLGSVVLNCEGQPDAEQWDIVDGQQRLTTLTIIFAVIRDFATTYLQNPLDSAFVSLSANEQLNREKAERVKLMASNLVVRMGEPDNYYLRLNDKDQPVFYQDVQRPAPALTQPEDWRVVKGEKRVKRAKRHFSKVVYKTFIVQPEGFVRLEAFLRFCMTRLLLLRINVETDSDAYLLFESLNDRGLELSIADLVKNRLLVACAQDSERKARVLQKWEQMVDSLKESRYASQDFLRFYWAANHDSVTSRELYSAIKKHLTENNPEDLVDSLVKSSTYFVQITKRSLRYPAGSYTPESVEQKYAEINTLGYSVCYPLFLWCNENRPDLLNDIVPFSVAYLFRLITVARFTAGKAEAAFTESLKTLKQNATAASGSVMSKFRDEELHDERFKQRLTQGRFDDNKAARYFLSRLHDVYHAGGATRLTSEVQLEHVLPVSENSWSGFDTGGRDRKDWVYNLGNMTLLERPLNQSIQAAPFATKVARYRKRSGALAQEGATSIPMTYQIYERHIADGSDWSVEWIKDRVADFADKAVDIWSIPPDLQPAPASGSQQGSEQFSPHQI